MNTVLANPDPQFDASREVTREEVKQWAASRADDAGFLARQLVALWKTPAPLVQQSADETHRCPICAQPFKPEDVCADDITDGPCHAACLEGSPVVDLETGEETGGTVDTYSYSEIMDPPLTPEITFDVHAIEKAGRAFCDTVVSAIHDKARARGGSASMSGSEYYMYPPAIESFDKAIEAALATISAPAPNPQMRGDLDWTEVAKLAGRHGIRYPSNAALKTFLQGLGRGNEDVAPCTVCGNEECGQGGYLSCECPAKASTISVSLNADTKAAQGLLAHYRQIIDAARGMKRIVEEIDGTMNHGAWRDERGLRLKDTPEWVALYNVLSAIGATDGQS